MLFIFPMEAVSPAQDTFNNTNGGHVQMLSDQL